MRQSEQDDKHGGRPEDDAELPGYRTARNSPSEGTAGLVLFARTGIEGRMHQSLRKNR